MANFIKEANAAKERGARSFQFKKKDGTTRTYYAHKRGHLVVWKPRKSKKTTKSR